MCAKRDKGQKCQCIIIYNSKKSETAEMSTTGKGKANLCYSYTNNHECSHTAIKMHEKSHMYQQRRKFQVLKLRPQILLLGIKIQFYLLLLKNFLQNHLYIICGYPCNKSTLSVHVPESDYKITEYFRKMVSSRVGAHRVRLGWNSGDFNCLSTVLLISDKSETKKKNMRK